MPQESVREIPWTAYFAVRTRICVYVVDWIRLFSESVNSAELEQISARPNSLIILADDLSYSDLGCFDCELETPILDRLAEHGLRFARYHWWRAVFRMQQPVF